MAPESVRSEREALFIPSRPAFIGASLPAKLTPRRCRDLPMACQLFHAVSYRRTKRHLAVEPLATGATTQGSWIDAWQRGGDRFSHWLFDVWPKLHAWRAMGGEAEPNLIINDCGERLRQETFSALNLIPRRLVLTDKKSAAVAADVVLRLEGGRDGLYTPPWIIEAVRGAFLAGAPHAGRRRLYISRAGAARRKVSNEPELVDLLAGRGFQVVELEKLGLREAAMLFSEAEAVVAPHGAGLANIVFCPEDCRVVEFFSHHISPEYWLLAARMGLDYVSIECPAPDGRRLSDLPEELANDRDLCNPIDIVADLQAIAAAI